MPMYAPADAGGILREAEHGSKRADGSGGGSGRDIRLHAAWDQGAPDSATDGAALRAIKEDSSGGPCTVLFRLTTLLSKRFRMMFVPPPKVAPNWSKSGQSWSNSGRMLGCGPSLAEFAPNLAKIWPDLVKVGPSVVDVGPMLVQVGRTRAKCWAMPGKCWPSLVEFGPRPRCGRFGWNAPPMSTIGTKSTKFDRCRHHFSQDQGGFCPDLAKYQPAI